MLDKEENRKRRGSAARWIYQFGFNRGTHMNQLAERFESFYPDAAAAEAEAAEEASACNCDGDGGGDGDGDGDGDTRRPVNILCLDGGGMKGKQLYGCCILVSMVDSD